MPTHRVIMPTSAEFTLRGDVAPLEGTKEVRMRSRMKMRSDGGVISWGLVSMQLAPHSIEAASKAF